jgi:hypothetical protein
LKLTKPGELWRLRSLTPVFDGLAVGARKGHSGSALLLLTRYTRGEVGPTLSPAFLLSSLSTEDATALCKVQATGSNGGDSSAQRFAVRSSAIGRLALQRGACLWPNAAGSRLGLRGLALQRGGGAGRTWPSRRTGLAQSWQSSRCRATICRAGVSGRALAGYEAKRCWRNNDAIEQGVEADEAWLTMETSQLNSSVVRTFLRSAAW